MGEMSGLSGLLKIMTTVPGPHESVKQTSTCVLGGGFQQTYVHPDIPGEMIQFDEHIFQMG